MTTHTTPCQASAGAPAMKSVAAAAEASFSAPACGQEPTASEGKLLRFRTFRFQYVYIRTYTSQLLPAVFIQTASGGGFQSFVDCGRFRALRRIIS